MVGTYLHRLSVPMDEHRIAQRRRILKPGTIMLMAAASIVRFAISQRRALHLRRQVPLAFRRMSH